MKYRIFGVSALVLLTGSSAFAQNRYEGLPYRQDYRQEVRGSVFWSKGDRLPRHYLSGEFVVRDYWGDNLDKPPRGYHWVRVNNQFILIRSSNGDIREVVRIIDRSDGD